MALDATHDLSARTFVPIPDGSSFPLQNLPFGVFRPAAGGPPRVGVAIGAQVLDLAALEAVGLFADPALAGRTVFAQPALNAFLALGRPAWHAARATVSRLLRDEPGALRDTAALREAALHDAAGVTMLLPAEIGDYTDFYSSREHATNVGTMFRGKDNALMPNWLHLPVGYHGRASSIVVSGTPVRRPRGQVMPDGADAPRFAATRQLDFELEVGFLVGPGNPLGEPVAASAAEERIFGFVLVNDWSARDIQKWEYVPLGPFLAKNFATSISPWVVTLEALEPFRTQGPAQDPEPLPYLRTPGNPTWDIDLFVDLRAEGMHAPATISTSNFRYLYWNPAQQLAHHTVGGCNLRPGDLLASGTISGPTPDSRGSMLELAWRGTEPVALPGGRTRVFLEDGDELTIRGRAARGAASIGFGEVSGRVLPAQEC